MKRGNSEAFAGLLVKFLKKRGVDAELLMVTGPGGAEEFSELIRIAGGRLPGTDFVGRPVWLCGDAWIRVCCDGMLWLACREPVVLDPDKYFRREEARDKQCLNEADGPLFQQLSGEEIDILLRKARSDENGVIPEEGDGSHISEQEELRLLRMLNESPYKISAAGRNIENSLDYNGIYHADLWSVESAGRAAEWTVNELNGVCREMDRICKELDCTRVRKETNGS